MPRTSDLPFEIRKSSIQGKGAFATRRIRPGQRIVEYTGERITPDEGDARYTEDGMQRHHTFLFTLDDDTVIDGAKGGNESRYINHACDPNCEAVIEDGRIFIYAKKGIAPGAELTYDYQYERTDAHTEEDERFYACRCGSPKCRGTILAPKKSTRARAAGSAKRTKKATGAKKKTATKGTKSAKKATSTKRAGKVAKRASTTKRTRATKGTTTRKRVAR